MSQSEDNYRRREKKPGFIIKPRRCFADEGGPGKFKASVEGEPQPSIEWQRDGVTLVPSDKYRMFADEDFHYLELQNVEKSDKGTYSCVISNSLGTATVSAELEVYAVRRAAEPKPATSILSTAKKFSAPGTGNLSTPAAVFTKKEPETSQFKSLRQRESANGNSPQSPATSLASSRFRGGSSSDQPTRSSRLQNGQEPKLTNGSVRSTQESVVSKMAGKFGEESRSANSTGGTRSERTLSSSNTSTLKASEPELKAYEPVTSKVSSWRDKGRVVKEDENKNEMPTVTLELSGRGDKTRLDFQTSSQAQDEVKNDGKGSSVTVSSVTSLRSRKQDSAARDEYGLNKDSGNSSAKSFGISSDRLNSVKSRFNKEEPKLDKTSEKPAPVQSVMDTQAEEPVSATRKTKGSKLRSLSKKFAEFEENDQEFFSPSRSKSLKERENSVASSKDDDVKVSDDVEKESVSSSVLSSEEPGSVGDKAETSNIAEKVEETSASEVVNQKDDILNSEIDTAEAEDTKPAVETKEVVEEHPPVKQQVKEVKKATVVKSPASAKLSEPRSFTSTGRKTGELKSSGSKPSESKTAFGSKTTDSRVSSAGRGVSSRVSKTSQESTKSSSRFSPEASKTSRASPETNKTTPKSKAQGQTDTSKTSVRNRYQPQMSPSTKRLGSAHDLKTPTTTTSSAKRATGARSGPISTRGGPAGETPTGRRAVGGKAPEVSQALADKEARDGEYVSLKCSFTGTPSPTVAWYCNGAILKDSTEMKQQFDGQWATLKFKDVFPDDTGRYEAVATNKAGEARTACLLTVKEAKPPKVAPSFTKPLFDQTVNDGAELELSCEYTGNPEPQLTWYHEGKVVEPCKDFVVTSANGVASLKIVEVFPEDAGLYELLAVNEKGEMKTVANLTVNEPVQELEEKAPEAATSQMEKPSFTRGLKDLVVYDGEKVTLQVEVAGSLPIEVCWVHGQKEIAADDNVYQVSAEGRVHKLVIPDVLPEDEGVWVCEAYNNYGDVDTSCKLTVRGVSEKSATASASSYDSQNKEEFNEEAISRDKNILAERKGKIRNENLNQPPKFILKPKSLTTDEGNGAKFVCEVVGNPVPRVIWRKDGVELNNASRFKSWHDGWKYYFEITHTLVTDEGKYQCVATSNQGEISCHIDLVVNKLDSPAEISDFRSLLKSRPQLGKIGSRGSTTSESEAEQLDFRGVLTRHVKTKSKPKFLKELRDVKCNEGQAVTLNCRVTGTPAPTITWLQGQKEIKESRFFKMSYSDNQATLHIAGVYPEDQGEYICVAENEAGVTESMCDIDIDYSTRDSAPRGPPTEAPPAPPAFMDQDLEPPFIEELNPENVSVLAGKPFTLTAKFVGSQPLTVAWSRGKRNIQSGDRFRIETSSSASFLTVSDSKCGDTGIYTMSLSNANGTDSITASVTVQDLQVTSENGECN